MSDEGGSGNPVILDPWQSIVGVGWANPTTTTTVFHNGSYTGYEGDLGPPPEGIVSYYPGTGVPGALPVHWPYEPGGPSGTITKPTTVVDLGGFSGASEAALYYTTVFVATTKDHSGHVINTVTLTSYGALNVPTTGTITATITTDSNGNDKFQGWS